MKDHLTGRQNAIKEVDDAELNSYLDALAQAFGLDWLTAGGAAPLQQLWARRDFLATNQLLLLGDAVQHLGSINPAWAKQQVKLVKGNDANNSRGAIFEFVGLNLFRQCGLGVVPATGSNPGYDGTVRYADGELRLSLKSYGASNPERTVEAKALKIRDLFAALLQKQDRSGFDLRIACKRYPTDDDWAALESALPSLIANLPADHAGVQVGEWSVFGRQLHLTGDEKLAPSRRSYMFVLWCPHHKNEHLNLESKLDEAAANFTRHAGDAAPSTRRGVLVRLHENASVAMCETWAKNYLAARQSSPLDAIFLYQPAVGQNIQEDTSTVVHSLVPVMNAAFVRWLAAGHPLSVRFLVGLTRSTAMPRELRNDEGHVLQLDDAYLIQRGEIYRLFEVKNGVGEAHLKNPASGIMYHAIMRQDDGAEIEFQGIYPPTHDVVLFS